MHIPECVVIVVIGLKGPYSSYCFSLSNFRIGLCSFDVTCIILEKDNFMKNVQAYIVLSC